MSNFKPIDPFVLESIRDNGDEYVLLKADSPEAKIASGWLEENFFITSGGRLDWDSVPDKVCKKWSSISDLLCVFRNLFGEESIKNEDVFVLWTNALKSILKLRMSTVLKYDKMILEEDWDTWIYSERHKWCIEVFHDGEICFGYSCKR